MLEHATSVLGECGLSINQDKCLTIVLRSEPKQKYTLLDESVRLTVGGRHLPAAKRMDEFRNLGVVFKGNGIVPFHPKRVLVPLLQILDAAPLKLQQIMYALRTFLIPKLYHGLSLCDVYLGTMKNRDITIRSFVRKWCGLPHEVPIAYFHAPVRAGCLGVPSARWNGPLQRVARLDKVRNSMESMEGDAKDILVARLERARKQLYHNERLITSVADVNRLFCDSQKVGIIVIW